MYHCALQEDRSGNRGYVVVDLQNTAGIHRELKVCVWGQVNSLYTLERLFCRHHEVPLGKSEHGRLRGYIRKFQ